MKPCPFFGKCGGCKFDFWAADYRALKLELLKNTLSYPNFVKVQHVSSSKTIPSCQGKEKKLAKPIWIQAGQRRRAEFAFQDGKFGFYAAASHNIVPIDNCPMLRPALNNFIQTCSYCEAIFSAKRTEWWTGSGQALITECENGLDVAIKSPIAFFPNWVRDLPAIRVIWNDKIVFQREQPLIYGRVYPPGAFLQPSAEGETILRGMLNLRGRILDLFAGLGALTQGLQAVRHDIFGGGRDLFRKPVRAAGLNKFDCIVMDPPRAGAELQCAEINKSFVPIVNYVSCSPETFMRDLEILSNYKLVGLTPVDQFPGTVHWELVSLLMRGQ